MDEAPPNETVTEAVESLETPLNAPEPVQQEITAEKAPQVE